MKRLLSILLLSTSLSAFGQNGDTLLYERFETGGATFTLNTTDLGGASGSAGSNAWIINNIYAGGSGQLVCLGFPFTFNIPATANQPAAQTGGTNTNYLHIVSDAGTSSGIQNCSFQASDGICTLDETNFSAMNQDVATTGYDSVTVSFLWLCSGGTNIYGELYYSTNSGISWNVINNPAQYKNQSNWAQQSITLASLAGQSTLRFGFRFLNQNSANAADPGFGIDEFMITGKNAGAPLVSAFSVSDSSLCQSGCVDFTDISTGNPTSWLWIFQGATTAFSTQQNPSQICYNSPGTYETTLIVTGSGGTDTLTTVAVIVHPNPAIPVITLSGDTLFAPAGYPTYIWTLNGNAIPGATDSIYVVPVDGAYAVILSDTNECSSESLPLNYVTGINEYHQENLLLVYPNPSNGNFEIQHTSEILTIEVINSLGKKVMQIKPEQKQSVRINLGNEAKGIYFINALHKNGNEINLKILTRE